MALDEKMLTLLRQAPLFEPLDDSDRRALLQEMR